MQWMTCLILTNIYSFNSSLYPKLIHTNVTWLNNELFPSILSNVIVPLLIQEHAAIKTYPGSYTRNTDQLCSLFVFYLKKLNFVAWFCY